MKNFFTAPQAIRIHHKAAGKRKAPRSFPFSLGCFAYLRVFAVSFFACGALLLLFLSSPALAAEPVPGDACSPAGATIASAEGTGGHFMICQGGTWKAVYSYNASGALIRLGNQTCSSGQVLKFNGTAWACAADAGGGTLDCQIVSSAAGSTTSVSVNCPAGYTATGGDCYASGSNPLMNCAPSGNGWSCLSSASTCYRVHARCCRIQ